MKDYVTQDDIGMIDYFLNNKGDIERWASWEDRKPVIERELPELVEAIKALDVAEKILARVSGSIINEIYKYPES